MAKTAESAAKAGTPGRKPGTIIAVKHALDVLRCFSDRDLLLGINELARRVGLHKSSISRIVATLEEARFLERDAATGRYRIGLGLVSLSAPALAPLRLDDVVKPFLQDLASRSGETASFNVWDGVTAVCVDQERGSHAIAYLAPPGFRKPAHCTAAGKVLLAHAGEADIGRILDRPLPRYTERTIADRDALLAELAQIRKQRYAVNRGEFGGDVGAVAAVVLGANDKTVGAIALTVPIYRFDRRRCAELKDSIVEAAELLSQRLGSTPA